jgi:hypothetical protein
LRANKNPIIIISGTGNNGKSYKILAAPIIKTLFMNSLLLRIVVVFVILVQITAGLFLQ